MRGKVNPKTPAGVLRRASSLRPKLAIILGSGFQSVTDALDLSQAVPFNKLAGFHKPSVKGHTGKALIGRLGGRETIIFQGRSHYYEGLKMSEVTFPIRVLAAYGIENLLLTNAAGGINGKYQPGELMLFSDHINFMGENPLRGTAQSDNSQFPDMTQVYDPALNKIIKSAARRSKIKLHSGVYCAVCGPSYETPAEIRAFKKLGADAVGMSTVPEAIVANQHNLRVAAISCITNRAAGLGNAKLTHEEVLKIGKSSSRTAANLLIEFAQNYD
ncbi:MAG: purine-nucleoside phosphorylase [Verrucomicrobiales bacterium]|nr:purine-nucleoside phosphorylase [Verrucomicrobiales bacterium]